MCQSPTRIYGAHPLPPKISHRPVVKPTPERATSPWILRLGTRGIGPSRSCPWTRRRISRSSRSASRMPSRPSHRQKRTSLWPWSQAAVIRGHGSAVSAHQHHVAAGGDGRARLPGGRQLAGGLGWRAPALIAPRCKRSSRFAVASTSAITQGVARAPATAVA